ncbi:hypothetical protein LINPERHAP2_LOCUS45937 [Linum perenne]
MATTGSSKSCRKPPRKNPNAPGSRTDPGWQYAVDVDGTAKKTKCKFCLKVYSGGIFRLKHHLAGTRDNVEECVSVPDDVRKKILELLDVHLEAKEAKKNLMSTSNSAASSSVSQDAIHSRYDVSMSISSGTQTTVSQLMKKDQRREACKGISQWFYKTATAFNGTRCEEYYRMFDLVARHGPGFKPPSYHEVRETFLQEEKKEVDAKLGHFRDEWKSLEDFDKNLKVHKSTIEKGRKITNFIYASGILISMLREFTKGHDLVRPGATRFATTYLTLACLRKKGSYSNIPKGKKVQGIVLDSRFWSNVSLCIRAALPLVKVLRLVDSEEYPSMPFLFFELNQAKEKIKLNFSNNEARPLHYAAYWLNPRVHFSPEFQNTDKKMKLALYETVDRLTWDKAETLTIMSQLSSFHSARGMFSTYGAMQLIGRKQPADWWSSFGDDIPELQRFAIRVLSLTTSASGCS